MIDWNHVYFLGDLATSLTVEENRVSALATDIDRVGMNTHPGITKQNMVYGSGPLQYFLIPWYLTGPVGTGNLRLRVWYRRDESTCT